MAVFSYTFVCWALAPFLALICFIQWASLALICFLQWASLAILAILTSLWSYAFDMDQRGTEVFRSRPRIISCKAPTESSIETATQSRDRSLSTSTNTSAPTTAPSTIETDASQLEPLYFNSSRDLEDIFRQMQPHFEGKETEFNWTIREKDIITLRRITMGNAPTDFANTYLTSIKTSLDGILKVVTSLRTTPVTNGCLLVQEMACKVGPGLDNMVEILLQNLVKVCAGTKHISAQNGNTTVISILANVSYNIRLLQHIHSACQDKNVKPRTFATVWLKTLIERHARHKSLLEHGNGLELVEKSIKKGLTDANPTVRENMRPTYWAYFRVWPDRAQQILNSLEDKQQALLLKDPSNPDAQTSEKVALTSKQQVPGKTTITVRPSLKEAIAAKKRLANSERPQSAQSNKSLERQPPRPATAMGTGSLSSAPLRPMRKASQHKVHLTTTSIPAQMKPEESILTTDSISMTSIPSQSKPEESILITDNISMTSIPAQFKPEESIVKTDSISSTSVRKIKSKPKSNTKANSVNTFGRLLGNGINRLRSRSLDEHGFLKLQRLVKESINFAKSGRFNDLAVALFDTLEVSPDEQMKVQALATLRTMLQTHTKLFLPLAPRAFCSLLTALSGCTKGATALDTSIDSAFEALTSKLETVSDSMEAIENFMAAADDMHPHFQLVGTKVLAGLLRHNTNNLKNSELNFNLYERLTALAVKGMANLLSDIRRVSFLLSSALFHAIDSASTFWTLTDGIRDEDRALLTYFLAAGTDDDLGMD